MEYYEVAAKWWADKLRDPPKETPEDMSSFTEEDYEAFFMKRYQQLELGDSPERIDKFQKNLSESIKKEVETKGETIIAVDYKQSYIFGEHSISAIIYPLCLFFQEALEKARISWSNLPLKAIMWISPKEVVVTKGYESPRIRIFIA